MDEEKNSNFDINTKYEDMINTSQRIIEHREFVSDGSCEPPNYICLAYDVKNYLPDLLRENQELKKQLSNDHQIKNQQKEFIEWLEIRIKDRDKVRKMHELYSLSEERLSSQYFILQDVLSKYKEIIGVNGN